MQPKTNIYIGTVCLERTRWGKREPSFVVSEWLPRFSADAFDGIELWSYHYTRAEAAEQQRLVAAAPIAIYNSYVAFTDQAAEERVQEAAIIQQLGASAVKFNIGNNPDLLATYKQNLIAWANTLPANCLLLCECHPGTLLETAAAAAAFHADLDSDRFGIIVHVGNTRVEEIATWLETFGARVRHLHIQFRNPETDPGNPAARPAIDRAFATINKHHFSGSITMEFTRGIGRDENIETIYQNACADMAYVRSQFA